MANPTIVQAIAFSSISNATVALSISNGGSLYINIDPVSVGNSIGVFFDHDVQHTPITDWFTVTDDQGNTYSGFTGGQNATNDQGSGGFYTINVPTVVNHVQINNISGSGRAYVGGVLVVMNDVVAADVVVGGTAGNSASVTGGSLTPSQTGDFICLYAARTSTTQTTSFTPTSQANITWRLCTSDLIDGQAFQAGVYNSVAAFNPQMDMGTSSQWDSVCIAFKAGSSGSPASAFGVRAIHHTSVFALTDNPLTLQVPAIGNTLLILREGGSQPAFDGIINSITDSKGNSWAVTTSVENDASNQIAYAFSITGGNNVILTINLATSGGHQTYMIYDIAGADTSPIGNIVTNTGTQAGTGDVTTLSITPTVIGAVLGFYGQEQATAKGLTDTQMIFDAIHFDGETEDGPCASDENNGWGHVYTTDTSTRTFTWQKTTARASARWESSAIAIKASVSIPVVLMGQAIL